MKTLLLMRHAKSSWDNESLADHARPLNERGRTDAPRMGAFLAEKELIPDLVLCSSSLRTRQTARGLFEGLGQEVPISLLRELYQGGLDSYVAALQGAEGPSERVMIIAHNPGLEYALEQFTGEREQMPSATVAQIDFPIDEWSQLSEDTEGRLVGLWRPREIA